MPRKGGKLSPAQLAILVDSAANHNRGRHHSAEHRAKISAGNMGKKMPPRSPERIASFVALSVAYRKGRPLSEEHKGKIGDGNRGKKAGRTWDEMYGKERADRMRESASNAHRGEKNARWGVHMTDEQKKAHGDKIRGKLIGPKHPNWKGGKGYGYDYNVSTPEWIRTRGVIYERDRWRCSICGKHCGKGREIQCHHINPFLISGSNDHDNLVTLCVVCHRKEEAALRRGESFLPEVMPQSACWELYH